MTMTELFGEVIHRYTRAQAIEDGMLLDVSTPAREAGFAIPVALTLGTWDAAVEVPAGCDGFQDEAGRLWDVLFVAMCSCRRTTGQRAAFAVSVVTSARGARHTVRLVAHIGPGDTAEPVVTIMLPGED